MSLASARVMLNFAEKLTKYQTNDPKYNEFVSNNYTHIITCLGGMSNIIHLCLTSSLAPEAINNDNLGQLQRLFDDHYNDVEFERNIIDNINSVAVTQSTATKDQTLIDHENNNQSDAAIVRSSSISINTIAESQGHVHNTNGAAVNSYSASVNTHDSTVSNI